MRERVVSGPVPSRSPIARATRSTARHVDSDHGRSVRAQKISSCSKSGNRGALLRRPIPLAGAHMNRHARRSRPSRPRRHQHPDLRKARFHVDGKLSVAYVRGVVHLQEHRDLLHTVSTSVSRFQNPPYNIVDKHKNSLTKRSAVQQVSYNPSPFVGDIVGDTAWRRRLSDRKLRALKHSGGSPDRTPLRPARADPPGHQGQFQSVVPTITIQGRRRDIGLGSYPSVSLAAARETAFTIARARAAERTPSRPATSPGSPLTGPHPPDLRCPHRGGDRDPPCWLALRAH